MARILIAEDHAVVRHGLRELLGSRPGWEVCGEARTGRTAVELAKQLRPDVAVVDLSLPELCGVEVMRKIHAEAQETEMAVFTMHEDELLLRDAVCAGARAYVLKSEPGASILDAVAALLRHEPYFSQRVAGLLVQALVRARRSPDEGPLTGREREIVQLLVEGLGRRAVASQLAITPKTVDAHRSVILRKLGLSSMADLVRYAIRQRIVQP